MPTAEYLTVRPEELMRNLIIAFAMLLFVDLAVAGTPVPLPFQSIKIDVVLDAPYGKSTFEMVCSSSKSEFSRKILVLRLVTEKGEFHAKPDLLDKFRNPAGIVLWSSMGEHTMDISLEYESEPRYVIGPRVSLYFQDGEFHDANQ
jgi:hypothetical protein